MVLVGFLYEYRSWPEVEVEVAHRVREEPVSVAHGGREDTRSVKPEDRETIMLTKPGSGDAGMTAKPGEGNISTLLKRDCEVTSSEWPSQLMTLAEPGGGSTYLAKPVGRALTRWSHVVKQCPWRSKVLQQCPWWSLVVE